MQEVLDVLKAAELEDWEQANVDDLTFDDVNVWYGIRQDNRIVSICWPPPFPEIFTKWWFYVIVGGIMMAGVGAVDITKRKNSTER